MQQDAFKLHEGLKLHTFPFSMHPELWDRFPIHSNVIKELEWEEIKFLNEDGSNFSDEIENLPNDKGGIYLFIIRSHVLPNISDYLAYIGRARITDGHNLRVRCRRYLTSYLKEKERPKISTLVGYYGNRLVLKYAVIENNELIIQLEAELINSLLPPFNDEIPDKVIRQAVNAF